VGKAQSGRRSPQAIPSGPGRGVRRRKKLAWEREGEVRPIYTFLLIAFLTAQFGMAQATPDQKPAAPEKEKKSSSSDNAETPGPTAFVQGAGNYFNMGAVATYDFDLGYRFNPHLSVDLGLPLMTTRTAYSVISTKDWRYTTIISAPYIDVRYDTRHNGNNITSILTGAAGFNMVKTYSNGRMTADLFNHIDHPYQISNFPVLFAPFMNLGGGTGTVDQQLMLRPFQMSRPYETLGYLGYGEAGGNFTFFKHYTLGGSAYGLAPAGPQKVYSRIVAPDSLLGGDGHHNRYWDQYFETGGQLFNIYGGGASRIARDNGYSAWLQITRYKNITVDLAFSHSVHYEYGSSYVIIRYNFTGILRNLTTGE